jgi:hypothetical protein
MCANRTGEAEGRAWFVRATDSADSAHTHTTGLEFRFLQVLQVTQHNEACLSSHAAHLLHAKTRHEPNYSNPSWQVQNRPILPPLPVEPPRSRLAKIDRGFDFGRRCHDDYYQIMIYIYLQAVNY